MQLNTANTITDNSGNARNGTLNNFALTNTTSNWTAPGGVTTGTTCAAFAGSSTVAPTVMSATQSFAFGASVANIAVTGTNILWYATATGGSALLSTTTLVSGTTYYASQTILSCESNSRVAVLVTVAAPIPGASLNFDGTKDRIGLPSFNFSTSDKLTIEAWIKPNSFSNTIAHISNQGPLAGTQEPDFSLAFKQNGAKLIFGLRTTANYIYDELQVNLNTSPTNELLDGNWHHIAAVYDGATRKIYIDGVLRGTNSKTGPVTQFYTGQGNVIGNDLLNTGPFNGNIDEVRYWSRALTGCELNNNQNCELPSGQTNLHAYYKFNSGNANANNTGVSSLADSSGNNRNGTLTNFTLLAGNTSNWATPGGVAIGTTCSTFVGSSTPAPQASANQTLCGGLTVANLVANGTNLRWYSEATGGSELANSTLLINGTTYYGSQTIAGCEGTSRTAVAVSLTTPPVAPIATATQSIQGSGTIADLTATALALGTINWYATGTGGTALAATTTLVNGTTYYASQTIGGCESVSRTAVLASFTFTGSSLNFDGGNDAVDMTGVVLGEQGITIELWVKPNNFNNNTSMLVHRAGHPNHAAGTDPLYYLAFTNFGTNLVFGLKTGLQFCCPTFPNPVQSNQLSVTITPASFLDGNWHHIAAVFDGLTRKMYVDGVLVGSDIRYGSVFESVPQTALTIGNINSNSGFNGNIDEVRLWARPLPACEIVANKDCELPSGQTGLSGYFKFNDGNSDTLNPTNSVLYNASGTVNGILRNFALTGTSSNWTTPGGVTTGTTCAVYVPIPAPTATATQTVCDRSTLATLIAAGTNIKWYATASGGIALATTTVLEPGNYFASQTSNGCESANRTQVTVAFFAPTPAPTAIATQIFVSGSTLESLPVTGQNIVWYASSTGGSPLSKTTLVDTGTVYYAAQTLNGCESVGRVAISATQISPATQTLPSPATLADLIVTVPSGYQAYWFSSMTSTPSLPITTILVTGTYYVLIAPIGSNLRLANSAQSNRVAVEIIVTGTLGLQTENAKLDIQLNPNPSNGIFNFNLSNDSKIEVYNQVGQLILSQNKTTGTNTIDIRNYSSGIYFLKVANADQSNVFKLIKQ